VTALAGLLLVAFAGLSAWEMVGDSVTGDERVHLPAGYAYWKTREFRLNPEHPPFVKLLASLPLLAMELDLPRTHPERGQDYWDYNAYQHVFGSRFLFTQDADRILFWGRLPVLALGLLLALLVFLWSSSLHGHPGAGLVSLFLLVFEPTFLAHSHYVTTDVALACFSVMALFFLWRFHRGARLVDLALASLGLGLALASKFSAVFLVPIFLLLLYVGWPARDGEAGESSPASGSSRRRILIGVGALVAAALVVQASYLFSPDPLLYLRGLRAVNANHLPNYPFYAAGTFFPGGAHWYPLYAWLLKTPLPALAALAVAAASCRRIPRGQRMSLLFLLLPAAGFTSAICAFSANLGVRYMIPATAFLLVLAGRSFFVFSSGRWSKAAGAVLAVWLVASVLRVSPHFISYFNELVGGPRNAPYYLDDSNVDWGQDLKRLVEHLREERIGEVVLSFWGPAPPEHYGERYGIRFEPFTVGMARREKPPAGVYALSVNRLIALRRLSFLIGGDPALDWLERFQPADRVGHSIYIYRFP
jgi:hypothetical protein